jgi:DtxR family transcriptional regulator, iron-dependent repressor
MPTPTVEEYLEVIYMVEAEGQTVKGARLAKTMGVSRPAVAATLRRMARDGLVKVNASKDIELTRRGFKTADDLQRRHRIVERWLTDILRFDWAKSDAEAHRLEHVMSGEVIERLNELLGRPTTCPHGNPIPGNTHSRISSKVFQLSHARGGDHVRVTRISEYAENVGELLRYLGDCGLRPGAEVTVSDVAPLHNSVTLRVKNKHFSLTREIAEYVWVIKAG